MSTTEKNGTERESWGIGCNMCMGHSHQVLSAPDQKQKMWTIVMATIEFSLEIH